MGSIQIRNVPDAAHRRLKARAALAGQSLSEFALAELLRALERPTVADLVERVRELEPVATVESAAEAVRAERSAR